MDTMVCIKDNICMSRTSVVRTENGGKLANHFALLLQYSILDFNIRVMLVANDRGRLNNTV